MQPVATHRLIRGSVTAGKERLRACGLPPVPCFREAMDSAQLPQSRILYGPNHWPKISWLAVMRGDKKVVAVGPREWRGHGWHSARKGSIRGTTGFCDNKKGADKGRRRSELNKMIGMHAIASSILQSHLQVVTQKGSSEEAEAR